MKRLNVLKYCTFALLLTTLTVSRAEAAFEGVVQAYQPIITHMGIFLCQVTSIQYSGSTSNTDKVSETDKPNNLSTQEGYQNRNIANILNIKVNVKYNADPPWDLFGDTLKVEIRADSLKTSGHWAISHIDPDTVVLATIECVLANACTKKDIKIILIDIYRKPKARPSHLSFDLSTFNTYPRRKYFTSY